MRSSRTLGKSDLSGQLLLQSGRIYFEVSLKQAQETGLGTGLGDSE